MIRLEQGSEALAELTRATRHAKDIGRDVSIDIRPDGIAVKVGEGLWTPTLSARPRRDSRHIERTSS